MSLSFQSFNYLSNINCCMNKHLSQKQGKKKNPSLVKLPSLVEGSNIPSPDNRNTFSSSDRNISFPLNGQANAIGIIGGALADSTLSFAKKLKSDGDDDENALPIVLCSDPVLSKQLLSLERSSIPFLIGYKTETIDIDHTSIVENLRRKRIFLEKSGVCCVVMPCHISHSWHDEIKEGCSVPFLHMGECVAKELKEANLRPIEAGTPLRIGVLAANTTMAATLYKENLENEGFEVILPDKATMEHTVIPAVEALSRKDFEGAQNLFRIALQVLLVRAVNRIVLASDELRELLPPDDPLWKKCIDPMDALARSTVKYVQSIGRCK